MQPLWTFDSVVEVLGGEAEVSRLTGNASAAAVYNWRAKRNLFPPKHYFRMKEALREKGYYAPINLWGFSTVANLRKSACSN
jgi:hypothetical protein